MYTKIIGFAGHLGSVQFSNDALLDKYKIQSSAEWIEEHLGIQNRFWASELENTSDLASAACQKALDHAGILSEELDRIILGTSTADHTNVSTACKVQFKIKAKCPSVDVVAACASFIFALDFAINAIKAGNKKVMCLGVDLKSRFVNKKDYRFLPIFGDGGAAFVLAPTEIREGFLEHLVWSDGTHYDDLLNPAGGSAMPASIETVTQNLHSTHMYIDGKEAVKQSSTIMANLAKEVCERAAIDINEIDYFVPHQANIQIMKLMMAKLEQPNEKLYSTIHNTGNMVAGSVAYAFFHLLNTIAKPGQLILITSIGAGICGGAAIYKVPLK